MFPGDAAGLLGFRRAPEVWATLHVELIVSRALRTLAQGDHGEVPHAAWVLLDQRAFSFSRIRTRWWVEGEGPQIVFRSIAHQERSLAANHCRFPPGKLKLKELSEDPGSGFLATGRG